MPSRRPNVCRIIEEEMAKQGVKGEDIEPNGRVEPQPDPIWFIQERPKSLRFFLLKTTGGFECGRKQDYYKAPPSVHPCTHSWSSGQTWCIVDLKEKKILKPYRQRCKKHGACNASNEEEESGGDERTREEWEEYEAIPLYGRNTIKKLAEWAVKQHLINAGKIEDDYVPHRGYRKTPAHCQALCGACRRLGKRCC